MSYIIIFYDQYDSKENYIVWNAIGNATYDHLAELYVISPESQKRLEHILTENKIMYKISEKVPKIVKFKFTGEKNKKFCSSNKWTIKKILENNENGFNTNN